MQTWSIRALKNNKNKIIVFVERTSVRLVLSVRSFLSEFLHLRFARGGAPCSIWKKKEEVWSEEM